MADRTNEIKENRPERRDVLLWIPVLAGPIAWALTEQLSYMLTPTACWTGSHLLLYLVPVCTLLIVLACAVFAHGRWKRRAGGVDGDGGPRESRRALHGDGRVLALRLLRGGDPGGGGAEPDPAGVRLMALLLLHAGHHLDAETVLTWWTWEPVTLLLLALSGALYAVGSPGSGGGRGWGRGSGGGRRPVSRAAGSRSWWRCSRRSTLWAASSSRPTWRSTRC